MKQYDELVLEFLKCPLCGASLVFLGKDKLQCTKCEHVYSISSDGINRYASGLPSLRWE